MYRKIKVITFLSLSVLFSKMAGAQDMQQGESFAVTDSHASKLNVVQIESFKAVRTANRMELEWTSRQETALNHYILQQSADGKHFADVAMIFPNEMTDSLNLYKCPAKLSAGNQIFYRLAMVYTGGHIQTSQVFAYNATNGSTNIYTGQ